VRSGERRAGCGSSTWRAEGQRGAVKARHMAGEGSGVAQRTTEEEGAGGRRWGLMCNSRKAQGLHCKA
jgi:hypothetical protein